MDTPEIFTANELEEADGVRYLGFWPGFKPENFLLHKIFRNHHESLLRVVGPFLSERQRLFLRECVIREPKADYYVTGENCEPEFDIAAKQIGFWRSYSGNNLVLRFPNWMWHLDWPEIINQPPYERYGMRLSIDRLTSPINTFYNREDLCNRHHRAVIFATHLREPRDRLYNLVNQAIGCDGFGKAFETPVLGPKMPLLEEYTICLCPENSLGDGYITEKIPEAFHAGCIPITWCNPEDLAVDFNCEAVINLFGLSDDEIIKILRRILGDGQFVNSLRSVPLLKRTPSLEPLYDFLGKSIQ
jgi:hypothetical protein